MDKFTKNVLKRLKAARQFPTNTCPFSRHAQMIGETLARGKTYHMLTEEPEHCAGSILSTVLCLYESRTKIAELELALQRANGQSAQKK